MVLPVLAWGAVALAGAVSGYLAYDKWWDRKTIAVLGGRGVGKTTLIQYFATQKISESHEQTFLTAYDDMTVKIGNLTLKIKGGCDVGGSANLRGKWREQIQETDIIFYIIDISRIIGDGKDPDYIKNTQQDILDIKDAINNRRDKQGNIKVMILATHADKCPEFYSDRSSLEQKVVKSQVVETAEIAFGGSKYCQVIIGSLKDTKEAEKLVKHILSTTNK